MKKVCPVCGRINDSTATTCENFNCRRYLPESDTIPNIFKTSELFFSSVRNDVFLFSLLLALEAFIINLKPSIASIDSDLFQSGLFSVLVLIALIWIKIMIFAFNFYEQYLHTTLTDATALTDALDSCQIMLFPTLLISPILVILYAIYNVNTIHFVKNFSSVIIIVLVISYLMLLPYFRIKVIMGNKKNYALGFAFLLLFVFGYIFFNLSTEGYRISIHNVTNQSDFDRQVIPFIELHYQTQTLALLFLLVDISFIASLLIPPKMKK